jgi:nucleoside-diphosphate-sugar epimerase
VGADYRQWPTLLPAVMAAAIHACSTTGARLVYLDNLYSLGAPEGPMTEEDPVRPVDAKGQLRADVATLLHDATIRGDLHSATLRASDFYGTGAARTVTGALVLGPLAAGRRPTWPADLDQPHSLHHLPDVARALAVLGTDDRAQDRVWHLPADHALTGREFISLAAVALGRDGISPKALTRSLLAAAATVNRAARDTLALLHQYDRPYVIDGSAMTRTFGFHPTRHQEGLHRSATGLSDLRCK